MSDDAVVEWEQLGKYDADALVFVKDALEAADIRFRVVDDSPGSRYSPALGRMDKVAGMFDVQVPLGAVATARSVIEHWQEEAEEAAIRESGAPPENVTEEPEAPVAPRPARPMWPVLLAMAAAGGLALYFMQR